MPILTRALKKIRGIMTPLIFTRELGEFVELSLAIKVILRHICVPLSLKTYHFFKTFYYY